MLLADYLTRAEARKFSKFFLFNSIKHEKAASDCSDAALFVVA
jgi:hypothetical protein